MRPLCFAKYLLNITHTCWWQECPSCILYLLSTHVSGQIAIIKRFKMKKMMVKIIHMYKRTLLNIKRKTFIIKWTTRNNNFRFTLIRLTCSEFCFISTSRQKLTTYTLRWWQKCLNVTAKYKQIILIQSRFELGATWPMMSSPLQRSNRLY